MTAYTSDARRRSWRCVCVLCGRAALPLGTSVQLRRRVHGTHQYPALIDRAMNLDLHCTVPSWTAILYCRYLHAVISSAYRR